MELIYIYMESWDCRYKPVVEYLLSMKDTLGSISSSAGKKELKNDHVFKPVNLHLGMQKFLENLIEALCIKTHTLTLSNRKTAVIVYHYDKLLCCFFSYFILELSITYLLRCVCMCMQGCACEWTCGGQRLTPSVIPVS